MTRFLGNFGRATEEKEEEPSLFRSTSLNEESCACRPACHPRVFFDDQTDRVKGEGEPFPTLFFFSSKSRDTFARISNPRLDSDSRTFFVAEAWGKEGQISTHKGKFSHKGCCCCCCCCVPDVLLFSYLPIDPLYLEFVREFARARGRESSTEISLFRW